MLSTIGRSARSGQYLLRTLNAATTVTQTCSAGFATAGAPDRVVEVTSDQDFSAKLADVAGSGSLMICDFTAKWCGPCRMIAPVFSSLSNKYTDVTFVKIDIDNTALGNTVNDHSITGVPTFVYYKGGRRVESFSGARADMLESLIQKHAK
ncbi:hypothetical protein CHLRE_05g248500v5 [Chlamydomonas reinhardtii]|uniref:Thioredoxin o n=1 Tax=Chlamydomonas reinhardtii TaxID=3055 RepID=Q84XS0_CHLRE|nr:uncharacterized protein CHLRE_05g248500v5 [Chlamydomonas reinhardtii]AAO20259.1 thioredoxin o [Chlamydomonas reinhardtii]PNW83316.1 hypothetical protein CHLRE_05g248500v5 [Chlamydomonas reinhardtii]|eukprot:XP_001700771.1 thioredoxin o [Chlamydomonas reinhardtii]